jgi:hypothetical protein
MRHRTDDDGSVGIRVDTAEHAQITVTAYYPAYNSIKASRANAGGQHVFWYKIGKAPGGFQVTVEVSASDRGSTGDCATSFEQETIAVVSKPTPTHVAAAAPTPSPATSPTQADTGSSGAWCTASASIYDAGYDENNVYVNSNQPYTDATASADGDSWSYETNGSGYAEIYLNGPAPGAAITVTVGGATCYTSD